jgi:hypothetical protein
MGNVNGPLDAEIRLSPRVFVNGKWKTYDPVGKNDFWWSDK